MGRVLVAAGIGFYRRALKPFYPRDCLFKVSCSEKVLRAGQDGGLAEAWWAFAERFKTCRAGYSIASRDGVRGAVTERGVFLPEDQLCDALRAEIEDAFRCAEAASR